jgi:hypothetical protein
MKARCAWCEAEMPDVEAPIEQADAVSDKMCDACYEAWLKEWEKSQCTH